MKMKRNIFILIAAAVLAAIPTGCSVNEMEENILGSFPYLELEEESMTVQKTASSAAIGFKSNRTVSMNRKSGGSWINATVQDGQIVFDWIQNDEETERVAEFEVSTPNSLVVKTIVVTQDPSGELIYEGYR